MFFKGNRVLLRDSPIQLLRLDDFYSENLGGQPVRFIKIDVQGYEEYVCLGMTGHPQENPQALVGLEYYPEGMRLLGFKGQDVLRFFQDREYSVYSLTRHRQLEPAHYGTIPTLLPATGYIDLLFSKSDKILDGTHR